MYTESRYCYWCPAARRSAPPRPPCAPITQAHGRPWALGAARPPHHNQSRSSQARMRRGTGNSPPARRRAPWACRRGRYNRESTKMPCVLPHFWAIRGTSPPIALSVVARLLQDSQYSCIYPRLQIQPCACHLNFAWVTEDTIGEAPAPLCKREALLCTHTAPPSLHSSHRANTTAPPSSACCLVTCVQSCRPVCADCCVLTR